MESFVKILPFDNLNFKKNGGFLPLTKRMPML
jgi:hypothetical protein